MANQVAGKVKNNGFEKESCISNDTEIIYKRNNNTVSYKNSLSASIIIPESELSLEKMSFIADKRNLIPDILAAQKITAKKNDLNIDDTISFFLRETYNDFKKGDEYIKELCFDYLGVKYLSKQTSAGTKYYIESIDDNKKYPPVKLENASSGMQTVTPLSVIVEYFSKYYNFQNSFNEIIFKYMSQSDSLVDVFEIIDGYLNNLKQPDKYLIDSSPLSEPISNIYDKYNELNK